MGMINTMGASSGMPCSYSQDQPSERRKRF